MILAIGPDMSRVPPKQYAWFVKAARGKRMEFGNGVGTYLDERLIAAEIKGENGTKHHYVKTKALK